MFQTCSGHQKLFQAFKNSLILELSNMLAFNFMKLNLTYHQNLKFYHIVYSAIQLLCITDELNGIFEP
jgi:hypothetical protein